MAFGLGFRSSPTRFPLILSLVFILIAGCLGYTLHDHSLHRSQRSPVVHRAISDSSQKLQSRGTQCNGRMRQETWWDNSEGNNPCVVLEQLLKQCGNNPKIPQPKNGRVDFDVKCHGSRKEQECCCNDRAYNLYHACLSCQAGSRGPDQDEDKRTNRGTYMGSCSGPATEPPPHIRDPINFPAFAKQGNAQHYVWNYDQVKSQFDKPNPPPARPPPAKTSAKAPNPPQPTPTPNPPKPSPDPPANPTNPLPGIPNPAPSNSVPAPVPGDPNQPPGESGATVTVTPDPTATRSESPNTTQSEPQEVNAPEEGEDGDGNSPSSDQPDKGHHGNSRDDDDDPEVKDGDEDGPNNGGGRPGSDPNSPPRDPNVSSRPSSGNIPAIVGGIIGGLILAGIIGTLCFCVIRNRRRAREHSMLYDYSIEYNTSRPEMGIIGGDAGTVWGLGGDQSQKRSGVESLNVAPTPRTSGYDYNGRVWTQAATTTMLPPMPTTSPNETAYQDDSSSESASMRSWTGRAI